MADATLALGFIGLGNMGAPLARRLLGAAPLFVFDPSEPALSAMVSEGAVAATSAAEVGRKASIVFTCLPTSEHVRETIFGVGGLAEGMPAGGIIVDMTTGAPSATRSMAVELSERQITLIDAPVSGGPRGAREGTIAILVGGDDDATYARVQPHLDRISSNVMRCGAVGAGHAIKGGNNLLNLICRMATFEVVSLLVKDGVDPNIAVAAIQKSSGRNYTTEITLPDNILSGKMHQGFTTGLMHKDATAALNLADVHAFDMPFGNLARAHLDEVIDVFGTTADMSDVARHFETRTGARIRPADNDV